MGIISFIKGLFINKQESLVDTNYVSKKRIWVHNYEDSKLILEGDLQYYQSIGYIKGRLPKKK